MCLQHLSETASRTHIPWQGSHSWVEGGRLATSSGVFKSSPFHFLRETRSNAVHLCGNEIKLVRAVVSACLATETDEQIVPPHGAAL